MRKLRVPVYDFSVNFRCLCRLFLTVKWWTFVAGFGNFSMENWQVVAVGYGWNCKLAKTTQENNCRIPCLVHGEHSGQPVTQYYCLERHACKTSAHAQGLYFQNGGCECELHDKNTLFELKSNFISIQNFKAGNVKPPGMHWSKDF